MTQQAEGIAPRVLFIAAAFPPYRAPEADHALQEALHLADEGLDVHVLTTNRPDVARPGSLTVHPVVDSWSWRDAPAVWRLISRLRPDAAMMFFLGGLYNYSTMALFVPAMVKLQRRNIRFVTQFSNLGQGAPSGDALNLRLRRALFRALGRYRYGTLLVLSDYLLVMSRLHMKRMAHIDARLQEKTLLVPPPPLLPILPDDGAAARKGRARLGIADDQFLFTYFSRLYPAKGVEMLLRAFANVLDELPGARLAMVGGYHSADAWWQRDSYPQEIERLTADLGLEHKVAWSGEYDWDSTDATEYLRATDVAILPFDRGVYLHNSSFASVAAHDLPTIVTRPSVGLEPEIVDGVNVYAIPARDQAALEDAMRRLYHDEALRRQLGEGARQLASQWFSWDTCVGRISECLGVRERIGVAATAERSLGG